MNEFASDVSKLGIPPSAKLTKSEWSMVRRRIRHRPRRFSKNFIIAQLGKRNLYRSIVRQVQRNPGSSHRLGFDVPASIRPGTKVTAYNKRCGVLNRGTVLFHDPAKKGYVIQFERKELGHEFCPDTEVATLCHVEWSPVESSLFPDRVSLPFGTSISIDSRKFLSKEFPYLNLSALTSLSPSRH